MRFVSICPCTHILPCTPVRPPYPAHTMHNMQRTNVYKIYTCTWHAHDKYTTGIGTLWTPNLTHLVPRPVVEYTLLLYWKENNTYNCTDIIYWYFPDVTIVCYLHIPCTCTCVCTYYDVTSYTCPPTCLLHITYMSSTYHLQLVQIVHVLYISTCPVQTVLPSINPLTTDSDAHVVYTHYCGNEGAFYHPEHLSKVAAALFTYTCHIYT